MEPMSETYERETTMTEPDCPKIHVANEIKIEKSEYVDENLIPTLQFNISVSKETLQDHKTLWSNYFKEYLEYNRYDHLNSDLEVKKQIIRSFVDKFDNYLWNEIIRGGND